MKYKTMKENARKAAEAEAFLDIVVGDAGASAGGSGHETGAACVGKLGRKTVLPGGLSPMEQRALKCSPLGLLGVQPALVAEILQWDRAARTKLEEMCWDNRLHEQLDLHADEQTTSEPQQAPWDARESYVNEMDE